jgi:glycosyltransferase involved in cell wall biosynthesis
MIKVTGPRPGESALTQRVRAVADVLLETPAFGDRDGDDSERVLERLIRAVQGDPSLDRIWLLCFAVFGVYPTSDDVTATARMMQLSPPTEAKAWLRARAVSTNERLTALRRRIEIEKAREQRGARDTIANRWRSTYRVTARAAVVHQARRVSWIIGPARLARARMVAARDRGAALRLAVRARAAPWIATRRPAGNLAELPAPVGELRVVSGGVLVDVDHSARHDLHTGIQMVVRRTLPIWSRDHDIHPVAWSDDWTLWRSLSHPERHRVLHRGNALVPASPQPEPPALIVPWRSVVVLAETPPEPACERLAALARYSGNAVVAVGYDCIPIVSADLVPAVDTQRFARYLSVLKHARRIAGVSRSATSEFRGFGAALPAQGLPGPTVIACPLPTQAAVSAPAPKTTPEPDRTTPLILSVGSLEPRKNHLALLYAAERLWRDHLHFELLLIAGSGWGDEVPQRIAQLQAQGRPLTTRTSVNDTDVAAAYRQARFSVFASLHEGYGLPVAESLAYGTPVITTNYGSTLDTAAAGGALVIDPRDDHALTDAMRRLLTDDHLLATLRQQLHTRPTRTWEHYAHDLWQHLVQPELPCPPAS